MNYDGNSLYPSAIWDDKSVYPKMKNGYAFTPHMNDTFVKTFSNQLFNQDGNESAT